MIISGYCKYNLLFHNCEHLVNKIIYGINYSQQVQCWKNKLLGRYLTNQKINLQKEILKNDRLIANLKITDQAKLTNKIKEIQEYTGLKFN